MQVAAVLPHGERPAATVGPHGRLVSFLVISVQMALVLLAVHLFEIEKQHHLLPLLFLAGGGFAVHAWLPARFRPGFFALLSMTGVLLVLGWPNGAWVIGLGAGLIALGSLPIPAWHRAALLAVAGLMLAMFRIQFDVPFWPVLGSMFMFRLIVYLYDTRHDCGRPPVFHVLSYFFCLPNVCFPLFPVIDYTTYRKKYQAGDAYPVYQTGVDWIARGLAHLLLYRVVKYHLLPAPHELRDPPHIALFLAANYALYLRVSGQFHVITGVLRLFGYALPRTHNNYFLASSFTDIWRRINVYWKDFMSKVFFFPALFACRSLGERAAFAVAAMGVFLATWLLHSYQVFWLRGNLSFSLNDAVLWLVAGSLVALNLQFDLSRGDPPATADKRPTLASAVRQSLQVVGMFSLISIFWACWNTPSVLTHLRAQALASPEALAGGAVVLGVLLAAAAAGTAAQLVRQWLTRLDRWPPTLSPTTSTLGLIAALGALILAGMPPVAGVFGPRAADAIARLRRESATPAEAAQAVQGYYEEITASPVPSGSWLALLEGRPVPVAGTVYSDLTRPADDWLERELIPGWSGEVRGSRLTINGLGMRDRPDRTRAKPPGACRIAMVGSSIVMGYGVGDDETFPALLEGRLNAARPAGGTRLEVLNFGEGMSHVIHRQVLIDRTVLAFEPDAIVYVAHQDEFLGSVQYLARLAAHGRALPYSALEGVVRQAGVTPNMPWSEVQARLEPLGPEIVRVTYAGIVDACRKRGVLPVWVYVPMPGVTDAPAQAATCMGLAKEAGFAVTDLTGWPDAHAPEQVKLGGTDFHVNALGHRLIAERLDAALRRGPDLLPTCARGRE